jgi:hypothetical protein
MSNKIPKPIFILFSFLIATVLYWPSLHGEPIWDDIFFLFESDHITPIFSFSKILLNFNWPISVIAHKWLFGIWNDHYFYYHLLNLTLHFLNSYLLLKLAERLKIPFHQWLFVFFLLHPANVISVSWMIQLKTLLCFLFGIISFHCLLKGRTNKIWYIASLMAFLLSTLAKSSSLPLPAFYFFFLFNKVRRKELIVIIPFLCMSLLGTYRILSSPVTTQSQEMLQKKNNEKFLLKPDTIVSVHENESDRPLPIPTFEPLHLALTASNYYFWQSFLPINNLPVKGLQYSKPELIDYLHLFFISLIIFINWNSAAILFLLGGYLMLLPFLGLISAPYMNITWVSDQHLYLALPFFISFWLTMLQKIKKRINYSAPILISCFSIFFCFKVYETTPYFKDEVTFYKAALEADPYNLPIAYNLTLSYIKKSDLINAYNLTEKYMPIAEQTSDFRANQYLSALYVLNNQLKLQKEVTK